MTVSILPEMVPEKVAEPATYFAVVMAVGLVIIAACDILSINVFATNGVGYDEMTVPGVMPTPEIIEPMVIVPLDSTSDTVKVVSEVNEGDVAEILPINDALLYAMGHAPTGPFFASIWNSSTPTSNPPILTAQRS